MILGHYQHFTILMILFVSPHLQAQEHFDENYDEAVGLEIMHEVYKRHRQYAFIYEEQSMVMMDKNGDRDTRKVKRYSRVEEDGAVKFLLLFDSPDEISGVALLANRDASGKTRKYIYLPAFGEQLIENVSSGRDGKFLGTDFSIENLAGEVLDDYIYIRKPDKKSNDIEHFVVDVYEREEGLPEDVLPKEKQANRRHFISKNNFYITRTEYFDRQGRVIKKQSHHDLKPVDGKMWRSNMILMEDSKEGHQSLIKINRRVFSRDYVSAEIFTADWLFKHYPFINSPDVDDEKFISEDEDAEVTLDNHNNSSTNMDIEIEAIQ
ncbi:MAG: outer membrane lipoprotein-sorting protein [Gammaproteobacteria bacterium]|nr:outer membrane lipoprotein-sorting protein [Gammaproteobacteria bacterium]